MYALEVDSLSKRFGKLQAVRELSFRVGRGQIYGLLGPNGSGKTTTIACALGLLRPDTGSAVVLGKPASQLALTAGKLGVVFDQDNLLGGLSVLANLEYARRLLGHTGGRSSADVLELTGISELAKQRASQLSLGQRKRVAVARALLGRPEFLVLDEPLSALDPLGVRATLDLIKQLASEGVSVLLSSHRLHELQEIVSHAMVMIDGRQVAEGKLQDLIGTNTRHYRLMLFDVDDAEAAAESMRKRFGGLQVTPGAKQESGSTCFELEGDLGAKFSASLCAELCAQGFKIQALIPHESSLEAFFDDLLQSNQVDR